jgi:hypothetical protein
VAKGKDLTMYRITNGQVEQVTQLPNVSGAELYLQSLPVSERQSMGIFERVEYGDYSEPVSSVSDDCIYAPMPAQPEPIKEPLTFSRLKLIEALRAGGFQRKNTPSTIGMVVIELNALEIVLIPIKPLPDFCDFVHVAAC